MLKNKLTRFVLMLITLLWSCGTLVTPGDKMTLEYDGPVTVSYFEISKNPNTTPQNPPTSFSQFNVNGEETFILKNMKNETAAYLARRFPGNSTEGILEILPGLNTAWLLKLNPQLDQQTIDSQALNHASGSDYELQIGNNSPVEIFSNIAVSITGAKLKKATYFTEATNDAKELNSDDINQILSDPAKNQILANSWGGPLTLLIKASGEEVKAEGGPTPSTASGPTSNTGPGGGTTSGGDTSGQLKGSGCLQLDPTVQTASTAWVWVTALCVAGMVLGRRRVLLRRRR